MSLTRLVPWRRRERKVPVRREEEHPLALWQRDVDAMFDDFFRGFGLTPFRGFEAQPGAFSPRVDIVDSEADIKITAELPGLEAGDVNVSVAQDVLTLSGEKREETEDRGKDYYRVERSYGSFRRSIPLPCEVDPDEADATFEKGVLTITLPKTRLEECKTIKVRAR